MYHYFYKITNLINNHFYYGVHNTEDLDDGYMGSGKRLHIAYKKYGIENFSKEIIKFFDSTEDAYNYEHEIVNEEMINDPNCYNLQIGGKYFNTNNKVPVIDVDGNSFWISKEDYIFRKNIDVKAIWQNKHHKEETKAKVRKKMTPKNSKNDRVWVYKNDKVKYLLKTKLDEYLKDGWQLGRVGYKPRKHSQGKLI